MANNPYINKVIYGDQTLVDLTEDTATEGDVVSGKTFHSADGQQRTGTYTVPTITPITPSNASPVNLTANNNYKPTIAGKAIESLNSITPSNASPVTLSSGIIYKANSAGKAVASVTEVTPSNSSPPSLASGTVYKPSAAGYAISSYSSIAPSATGTAFSSGFRKMSVAGYAYSSQQTVNYDLVVIAVNGTATFTMNNGVFILRTTSDDVIMYMGFVANGVLTNKINKTTYVSVSYATSTKKVTAKTKGIEVYLSIFTVN